MAADGHALIFISHKLNEIFALTDRVTVLRDGRVVGTRPTKDVTKKDLANMMVGREVLLERIRPPREVGDVRLKLDNVTAVNEDGKQVLKNVSFEVRSGEIVGVAGISGNGQRSLARSIAGLRVVNDGTITLDGKTVTHLTPSQMYKVGLSYIPEERMHDGVVKDFSVAENMILQDYVRRPFSKGIFLDFKYIAKHAGQLIKNFRVKTPTQNADQKFVRRQHPKAHFGPRTGPAAPPAHRRPAHARRGHWRDEVHSQPAVAAPQRRPGHPAHLRRFG
ncbi:MAG: ATP-binding cassette domain-containing protein [Chloroflexota bacterium]